MYSENRFPVKLYEGGPVGYAEGGLHDEALAVRRAGRNGDGRLVHVNDEEFAEMVAEYGEPTINPETGMPEFFLGKLLKVLKVVAPIAMNFIPGVGPLASAAVGAALGATGGGGLKGALLGGITGGLGGSGAASAIGGTVAKGASGIAQKAIGDAIIGGALGAATGQDPLKAALMSGGTSFLSGSLGPKAPATPTPTTAAPAASAPVSAGFSVTPENGLTLSPEFRANLSNIEGLDLDPISTAPVASAPVKFMNRDFLGIKGLPNKYGLGASALAAAAAYDLLKPKSKINEQTPEEFFGPAFGGSGGQPAGGFRLASNPMPAMPQSPMSEYERRYLSGYAGGGNVSGGGRSAGRSFAVEGRGTGRSDEIPAMLSDGEYVMDAETVAMLGDGSSKAGAKKLDDFRVKIRKQKGKKLARGKISQDAKSPERYMAGGRI